MNSTFKIGETLRALMSKNGIIKHKQVEYIKNSLNISQPQALRKLKDISPWDVVQISTICQKLEVSLSDFFAIVEGRDQELVTSSIEFNGEKLICNLILGNKPADNDSAFSAIKINEKWTIVKTCDLDIYNTRIDDTREVRLISIKPKNRATRKRVAILDDDKDITKTISQSLLLNMHDIKIEEFNSISSMLKANAFDVYDVYILDWLIGNNSALEVVEDIRNRLNSDALIIILTGQSGRKIDSDISYAISKYDVVGPYEKPIRLDVINSVINRYFGAKR